MNMFDKESQYANNDYRSRNYSGDWTKHFINNYVDSLFASGVTKTQEELVDAKNEHLPKSLFKFYPPSIYSLINIENQTLFLSTPKNFNDPFDSFMCIEAETFKKLFLLKKLKDLKLISKFESEDKISEKEYYELYHSWTKDEMPHYTLNGPNPKFFTFVLFDIRNKKSPELSDLLYETVEEARRECRRKIDYVRNLEFKISCFSNFKDETELLRNTTMWSHYADNHRGFCVKYKMDFQKKDNYNQIRCGLFPVNYTSKVPKISPRELMRLKFNNNDLELNKPVLKTAFKTLTTKSRFWNYEKEWRLIISSYDSDILTNNVMEFVDIEAIYLGCRIEENLKNHLVHFADNNKINIFQTKQSNEMFELKLTELYKKDIVDNEFQQKLYQINQISNLNDRHKKTQQILNKKYKR